MKRKTPSQNVPTVIGALKHFLAHFIYLDYYSSHVIKLSIIKAIATTRGNLPNAKNGSATPNRPRTKRSKFKTISTEYCEGATGLYVRACKRPLTA